MLPINSINNVSYDLRSREISTLATLIREKAITRLPAHYQTEAGRKLIDILAPLAEAYPEFCVKLFMQGEKQLNDVEKTASQLLFLHDHYPERLVGIDLKKNEKAREQIDLLAHEALLDLERAEHPEKRTWAHEMIRDNDDKKMSFDEARELFFQETDFSSVYETRWAVKIAHLLMDQTGRINRPLIPLVIETLFSRKDSSAADIHLKETLLHFYENPKLAEIVEAVGVPAREYQDVVRASLLLDPEKPVTSREAREALFAASLIRCRQVIGNCYVNAVAQFIQDRSTEEELRDMSELMQTGYISNTIDSKKMLFPGAVSLADQILGESFDFKKICPGCCIDALFAIPQFAAAFQSLGVSPAMLDGIIKKGSSMTVQQLFQVIQKKLQIPEEKIKRALFFVQSTTKMPLLQCWENGLLGAYFPPMTSKRVVGSTQQVFLYSMLRTLGDLAEEAGREIPACKSICSHLSPLRELSREEEQDRRRLVGILQKAEQKAGRNREALVSAALDAMNDQPNFVLGKSAQKLRDAQFAAIVFSACDDLSPRTTKERRSPFDCERAATQFIERVHIFKKISEQPCIDLGLPQYQPLNKFRLVPIIRNNDVWVELHVEEKGRFRSISSQDQFSKYCKSICFEIMSAHLSTREKLQLKRFFETKKDSYFFQSISSYFSTYYATTEFEVKKTVQHDPILTPMLYPLSERYDEWQNILFNKYVHGRRRFCNVTIGANKPTFPLKKISSLQKRCAEQFGVSDRVSLVCGHDTHIFRFIPASFQAPSGPELKKSQDMCKRVLLAQCPETQKAVLTAIATTIMEQGENNQERLTNKLQDIVRVGEQNKNSPITLSSWLKNLKEKLKDLAGAASEKKEKTHGTRAAEDEDPEEKVWQSFYKSIHQGFMKDQPDLAKALRIPFGDGNQDSQSEKRSIPMGMSFCFNPCTLTWQLVQADDKHVKEEVYYDEDEIQIINPKIFQSDMRR